LRFQPAEHISRANGSEITRDRSDKLRTKFLASNVHFNLLNFDHLGSRSLPYGGLKFGYFFKGGRLFRHYTLHSQGLPFEAIYRSISLVNRPNARLTGHLFGVQGAMRPTKGQTDKRSL